MTDMHPYEALKIALQEARDERDDWRESATRAAGESCGDERHCTCVGPLRKELRDAKAKLAALVEALSKIAHPTYGTEIHDTDSERADVYWQHIERFQRTARQALDAAENEPC